MSEATMSNGSITSGGNWRNLKELNGSFSGGDIVVTALFPQAPPVTLGHATTVTYSTFREVADIRALGRVGVKGFARGARTVAGTIIFTMINTHWINELKRTVPYLQSLPVLRTDELPPFDLILTAANEYGQAAMMILQGIQFVDEGATMSVENLFSESQTTYKAQDIRLFDSVTDGMASATASFMDPQLLPVYMLVPIKYEYKSGGATQAATVTQPPKRTPERQYRPGSRSGPLYDFE